MTQKRDIVAFCLKYELNAEELLAYEIIKRASPEECDLYVKKFGEPSPDVIRSLSKKGLVIITNTKEPHYLSTGIIRSIYQDEMADMEDMGEELWNAYPAAFPLSGGGMFIARKGPDKHEVIKIYLARINYNVDKHKYVLAQLKIYIKLVLDSKINGHRIYDWIINEMWDTIGGLEAASRGEFKTDI